MPRDHSTPGRCISEQGLKNGVQPTMTTQNSLSLSSRAGFRSLGVAPAANASTEISASPRPFTLMRTLSTLSQKPHFLSPLFATLTHSCSPKSFACHSYENTGMAYPTRPPGGTDPTRARVSRASTRNKTFVGGDPVCGCGAGKKHRRGLAQHAPLLQGRGWLIPFWTRGELRRSCERRRLAGPCARWRGR
jgi:hypothetical protein